MSETKKLNLIPQTRTHQAEKKKQPINQNKKRIRYRTKKRGTVERTALMREAFRKSLERRKKITSLKKKIKEEKKKIKIQEETTSWKKKPSMSSWLDGIVKSKIATAVSNKISPFSRKLSPLNINKEIIINAFSQHLFEFYRKNQRNGDKTKEYSKKKFAFLKKLLNILKGAQKKELNPKKLLEEYSKLCGVNFYSNETINQKEIKIILYRKAENINASISAFKKIIQHKITLKDLQKKERIFAAKETNKNKNSFNVKDSLNSGKTILKQTTFIYRKNNLVKDIEKSIPKTLAKQIKEKIIAHLKKLIKSKKIKEGSEITIEPNGKIKIISPTEVAKRLSKELAKKKAMQKKLKESKKKAKKEKGIWGFLNKATQVFIGVAKFFRKTVKWVKKSITTISSPFSYIKRIFKKIFSWF